MLQRGQVGKRSVKAPAFVKAGVFDNGDGGIRGKSGVNQTGSDVGGVRAAHIYRYRGSGNRKLGPIGKRLAFQVVAGGEYH